MTEPIEISQDILDKLRHPSTVTLTTVLNKKGFWNTFMRGVTPLKPEIDVHGLLTGGEGVVVIPRHVAVEVAGAVLAQEAHEDFLLEKIKGGASIVGTYLPDEATLAVYETWRKNK